jgi:hypothetical protein
VLSEAVGSYAHTAVLYSGPDKNIGSTSLVRRIGDEAETEKVRILPLSELLPGQHLSRISLVKIDVEGAEADALMGLEPIINELSSRLAIICEIAPARIRQFGGSPNSVLNRMRGHGFAPHRIKNIYGASAYLTAETSAPEPLDEPIGDMADVIFLRSARS